ncbi:MAG TPA: hypothetical protein VM510_02950, partial [Caulifigura sp.]|nr:hypothetical protein [Caulifigura sp.]
MSFAKLLLAARLRRGFLAVFLVAGAVASLPVHAADSDAVTLRIRFGMKDQKPSDWSGSLTPSVGKVESIHGWRWGDGDSADGEK